MKQYFATLPTNLCVEEIVRRIEKFNDYAERSGAKARWDKSGRYYYGEFLGEGANAGGVERVGDDGELTAYGVNHYRNLIKHVLALTTATKPAYDIRAKNSDLEAQQQARLYSNIHESYVTEKRMGRHMKSAAERALVFQAGFVYMPWDPSLGKPYGTQPAVDKDNQPILNEDGTQKEKVLYEGDPSICAKSPFDVMHDPSVRDESNHKWRIVRTYENKWDLASRHPAYAEQIISQGAEDELDRFKMGRLSRALALVSKDDDDIIPVYHFYHLKTDACPGGRYIKMLNGKIALYDDAFPYKKRLPIFRITPGEIFDTSDGYSDFVDVMVLQEVYNTLVSIPFTNQQAFGVQAIWMPEGCELAASQIGKGLVLLRGGPPGTEPKPLQLTATPAEIFKNMDFVRSEMEKLSGINATVRGDPEHNLKSAVALGRMQAMAIQYMSNFQTSWAELQEDCGTFLLELLQQFANTERLVAMAGKHNKGTMLTFTGKDLNLVDKVVVDLGNPLARTVAGRLEMADKLLEKGEINGKQYIQVATTGQIESALEAAQSQEELVRKENESLMEGKPVKAVVGDLHLLHATEHMTVINDPYLRQRAAEGDQRAIQIIEATTMHVMEHKDLYYAQDPFFSMVSKEPPPPMPPPPPPGMPGPGGPMPPPPPAGPMPPMPEPPPIPPLPPAPPPVIPPPVA